MNKKDRPYTIEEYNPKWVEKFEVEKDVIEKVFGETLISVEHVGSTSVPGIWAKPQIDIMGVVENITTVDQFIEKMREVGYEFDDDFIPDAKYFYKDAPSGERLVTIQIFPKGHPDIAQKICFRDYLRAHAEEANFYSKIKLEAYNKGKSDRIEYSKNKKEGLLEVLERAENWCAQNNSKNIK